MGRMNTQESVSNNILMYADLSSMRILDPIDFLYHGYILYLEEIRQNIKICSLKLRSFLRMQNFLNNISGTFF